MSKVFIGSIINGFKILKKIVNSIIPSNCIYKVKCLTCGAMYKLRLKDIESEVCECKETKDEIDEKRKFSPNMIENVGIRRGKYIVIGYFYKKDPNPSPSMKNKAKLYILKCTRCGELVIMNNNNINSFREKRDKEVRCNHKRFFDISLYDESEYFIDWKLTVENNKTM